MNLLVPIDELRAQCNLTPFVVSNYDEELIRYCLTAQQWAEGYCKRYFDGFVSRTEYFSSGDYGDKVVVRAYPILSVTSMKVSYSQDFSNVSPLDASSYFVFGNKGMIRSRNGGFYGSLVAQETNLQDDDIEVVYKGGFVGEQIVVAEATPTASHTVVAQTVFASQPFSVTVSLRVANVAGSVVLTGTDENGSAQTESIAFPLIASPITGYRLASKYSWKTITAVNGSAVNASGALLKVTATTVPDTLKTALALHAAHLFFQDSQQSLNIASRNIESDSESGYVKGVPKETIDLLQAYRDFL